MSNLFAGYCIVLFSEFVVISGSHILLLAGEIVTFVTISFFILILLPIKGKKISYSFDKKAVNDERDTMFSRNELKPGTELYTQYYSKNPATESKDSGWRSEPGLLKKGSVFYNKMAFAAADASFTTVKLFSELRDRKPENIPSDISGSDLTDFIKVWSKKLGAAGVGITEMKDYHYYTVAGRGDRYGASIRRNHSFGIVFLVEMDYDLVSAAPRSPAVMESANQYLRSANIATQVAEMIRNMGYSAKTHIDANYDVICPLVARDAGLGEIGRNGLLISDKYGPRVRVSVVTTDIPLKISSFNPDSSVIKFCSICKKCAVNCPAGSIANGPMEEVNGVMKWRVDQVSCFTYWNHCGTDCGRCISTCPYSHRNNLFHSLIRKGIKNNVLFLYLASFLDDIFYGKRPHSMKIKGLDS